MTDNAAFRELVDKELMSIRFLLKNKVASLDEVKREEEQIIESVKQVMTSLRELEHVLEQEIEMYRRMKGGWEKAYAQRRWEAIGRAIREEIEHFNKEYDHTKNTFDVCSRLAGRFQNIHELLKTLNSQNRQGREEELKMLESFREQKQRL